MNQGWKDSYDAIMHASGRLAEPPIALAEVQGYQYAALLAAAEMAEALGLTDRTPVLRERARRLRERFEADFWLADEAFYALALDRHASPAESSAPTPGTCCGRAWSATAAPRSWRAGSWARTCSPAGACARSPAASASTTR